MIAGEIGSLQPLPPPFAAAYNFCKTAGLSQKWYLNCVRMRRSDCDITVSRCGVTVPAVLVGNAAHAVPEIYSPADINWALTDSVELCRMIVERYDDDKLFSQISKDFYDLRCRSWHRKLQSWEEDWMTAHGLTYDSSETKSMWVKLVKTHRLAQQRTRNQNGFISLPERHRQALERYQNAEIARWNENRQKNQARRPGQFAFQIPTGIKPTELVVRYLDSKPVSAGRDERDVPESSDPEDTEKLSRPPKGNRVRKVLTYVARNNRVDR